MRDDDAEYVQFLEHLDKYQSEITDLLCLHRNIRDRYTCIHRYNKGGLFVLVYISSQTKQVVKLVINYQFDTDRAMPVISVLAEDTAIYVALTTSLTYQTIESTLLQLKQFASENKVFNKLKYNI